MNIDCVYVRLMSNKEALKLCKQFQKVLSKPLEYINSNDRTLYHLSDSIIKENSNRVILIYKIEHKIIITKDSIKEL